MCMHLHESDWLKQHLLLSENRLDLHQVLTKQKLAKRALVHLVIGSRPNEVRATTQVSQFYLENAVSEKQKMNQD